MTWSMTAVVVYGFVRASALRAARQQSAFLGSVLAVDKDFRRCWR